MSQCTEDVKGQNILEGFAGVVDNKGQPIRPDVFYSVCSDPKREQDNTNGKLYIPLHDEFA